MSKTKKSRGPVVSRDFIVAAARNMIGTPFYHRGRSPGVALDCWGLVICTAWAVGLEFEDFTDYGNRPSAEQVLSVIDARMYRASGALPGSMILTTIGGHPQHMGIRTEGGIIHAHNRIGGGSTTKVREERWSERWSSRVYGIYDYREVG